MADLGLKPILSIDDMFRVSTEPLEKLIARAKADDSEAKKSFITL